MKNSAELVSLRIHLCCFVGFNKRYCITVVFLKFSPITLSNNEEENHSVHVS